ncbi:MAG TPA: helix-turn-helix domain-containing protein [Acidimicrobiia bacterium]|nr:helix-turn-helix domain-containing protein [Acidimicrobiia bacterium]
MGHANDLEETLDAIGERIRDARVGAGLSQRELARRLGLSPSLISQLENNQSKPSVGTLYAIVTELEVSLDSVIRGEDTSQGTAAPTREPSQTESPVVNPGNRQTIELESGVRWEELTAGNEQGVDFLHATYEVGGSSTSDGSLMRHHGREYGYIVSGTLGVQIGFSEYELQPGDSIAFDSTRPHRLYNTGDVPVHAIWFVIDR